MKWLAKKRTFLEKRKQFLLPQTFALNQMCLMLRERMLLWPIKLEIFSKIDIPYILGTLVLDY